MKHSRQFFITALIGAYIFSMAVSAHAQQCLIVRSAEGHRFRNSMIAGVLTGGIGFAAGAAFSGGRYEYVDGTNFASPKMKYKGGELQKLQEQGVHVVVINKKAQADEIKSAHESCKQFVEEARRPAAAPAAVAPAAAAPTAVAPAAVSPAAVAPAAVTPAPQTQPAASPATVAPSAPVIEGSNPSEPQPNSVADAARRNREQKAQQQQDGNLR